MRRGRIDLLRWISIGLLIAAIGLIFYELVSYSRLRARLPDQLTIAGVPVGGLDKLEALERITQVYSTPVELYYDEDLILLNPANVGFRLDTEVMLAASEMARTETDFWSGFWDFLWNRPGEPYEIPLKSEYSQTELEAILKDIAARYDEPPEAPEPIPGTTNFSSGHAGHVLDISRARELIGDVINKPQERSVDLPIVSQEASRPSFSTLEILLKQNLDVAEFDGLAVIYLQDLRNGDEIHFARYRGADIEVEPDIAFTAASTIKIGIMITYYRYFDEPLDPDAEDWMYEMIVYSANETSDELMNRLSGMDGGVTPGPLVVTNTMRDLGLESTFLGGYFKLGSPLLIQPQTPGNQRTDVTTSPDPYNQTTASEIGMLLTDIYYCAEGGGSLLAAFSGDITQDECIKMLDLLSQNKLGWLIQGGVPEGTRVAHKHGYIDSPTEYLVDAGIVYTPGGNYLLSIFLWNDPPMIWDTASELVANLSRSVYNYFNSTGTR